MYHASALQADTRAYSPTSGGNMNAGLAAGAARVRQRHLPRQRPAGVHEGVQPDDREEHEPGARGVAREASDADAHDEGSEDRAAEDEQRELEPPRHAPAA